MPSTMPRIVDTLLFCTAPRPQLHGDTILSFREDARLVDARALQTTGTSHQAAPLGGPEMVGNVEKALLALVAVEEASCHAISCPRPHQHLRFSGSKRKVPQV